MISQRELERRYNALLQKVKTDDFFKVDLTNRVNCYTCPQGHLTKTIDIDSGVTPMWLTCKVCGSPTCSSFYRDIATNTHPTHEWYRPSLKELLKQRKKGSYIEHVLNGGLNIRHIMAKQ